jgi:hypothetical protein
MGVSPPVQFQSNVAFICMLPLLSPLNLRTVATRRRTAYNYSSANTGKRDVIGAGAIRGITHG